MDFARLLGQVPELGGVESIEFGFEIVMLVHNGGTCEHDYVDTSLVSKGEADWVHKKGQGGEYAWTGGSMVRNQEVGDYEDWANTVPDNNYWQEVYDDAIENWQNGKIGPGGPIGQSDSVVDADGGEVMNPGETRAAVLYVLNLLYLPIAADDLSLVTRLVKGVEVGEADLDALAEADRSSFRVGDEGSVWICPALEYSDGKSSDDFFARSDWPIRARIVRGGVPSKSKDLFLLRHLCDLVMGVDADEPLVTPLRERIDDLTIHFTESQLVERRAERGEDVDELEFYREFAEDLYGEVVRQEREVQRDAIEVLERLPPPARYFGVS